MSEERRSCARVRLRAEADFRRMREPAYPVPFDDLSTSGCRVEVPVGLTQGERVWIRLPGIESLPSTVRWSSEWKAGAQFDRPVHPAVFEMVVGRIR